MMAEVVATKRADSTYDGAAVKSSSGMAKSPNSEDPNGILHARLAIGKAWGLGRALTQAELARALNLSKFHINKLETGREGKVLGGPAKIALEAMMGGYKPPHFQTVFQDNAPSGWTALRIQRDRARAEGGEGAVARFDAEREAARAKRKARRDALNVEPGTADE